MREGGGACDTPRGPSADGTQGDKPPSPPSNPPSPEVQPYDGDDCDTSPGDADLDASPIMLEIDVTASIDDGRDHGREVVITSTSAGGVDDNKKEGGGAAIMGGAGASTAAGDHYLLKVDKTLATAHVAAAQRERSNSATVGGVCVANCGNCARCGNAKLSRENRSICDVRERVVAFGKRTPLLIQKRSRAQQVSRIRASLLWICLALLLFDGIILALDLSISSTTLGPAAMSPILMFMNESGTYFERANRPPFIAVDNASEAVGNTTAPGNLAALLLGPPVDFFNRSLIVLGMVDLSCGWACFLAHFLSRIVAFTFPLYTYTTLACCLSRKALVMQGLTGTWNSVVCVISFGGGVIQLRHPLLPAVVGGPSKVPLWQGILKCFSGTKGGDWFLTWVELTVLLIGAILYFSAALLLFEMAQLLTTTTVSTTLAANNKGGGKCCC